jgi:hypothetical protein
MTSPEKIGIASENSGVAMDRRVSVAPMMDYTDDRSFS